VFFHRHQRAGSDQEVELHRGEQVGGLAANLIQAPGQAPPPVVDPDALGQGLVGDRHSQLRLEVPRHPPVFGHLVVHGAGRGHVLSVVEILHVEVGEVPLEDAGEVSRHVADGGEDDGIQELQAPLEPQLQRRLGDGADEGLKPGIRVHEFDGGPTAEDP
jgi:hypothetical protein